MGFLRFLRGGCSCAGAEGRGGFDEGLEYVEESGALEEFEERGGLAAGDDEAVKCVELAGCG